LTKQAQTTHINTKNTNSQPRLINLTKINFTKEHINTLTLRPNYALERNPKSYINELIIDTENAIIHLDPKIQGIFRYMAATKIKHITVSCHYIFHKRHQHDLNQTKDNLNRNNLTIIKAHKYKAIFIFNKNSLEEKIKTCRHENRITRLNKAPTDSFQKHFSKPFNNAIH